MNEQYYAFIKNNIVEQVAVFSSQNEELANLVVQEQGYDNAIWVGENKPNIFSSYDVSTGQFTEPTEEYLYERGVLSETTAMRNERLAAEAAQQA
jgi:hypothetical protein